MIARCHRGRSGITLTEILISILIMGVGLISLATLFPLGLLRLRDAARFQRGGMLAQSATDDAEAKALLLKSSFIRTWYGGTQDPFTTDLAIGKYPAGGPVSTLGQARPGLPVCYDPLWRAVTNVVPVHDGLYDSVHLDYASTYRTAAAEARFGAGLVVDAKGTVQNAFGLADTTASAHGLQRITNFIPWSSKKATPFYPFTYQNPDVFTFPKQPLDVAGDTFTSLDDIVCNSLETSTTGKSPVLPDLSSGGPVSDWKYTWFFTGRQTDATNGTMFQGDIVVCDGRPFVIGPAPALTTVSVPVGETVVEAIFGFSSNIGTNGFANGADRTVLLRWPTSIPDPQVRNGGWIADVTYERDQAVTYGSTGRVQATGTPFQRCNWYQVTKRTEVQSDPIDSTFRRMIVTINTPVRAKTMVALNKSGDVQASVTNVALVMPSVINVYPRAFVLH